MGLLRFPDSLELGNLTEVGVGGMKVLGKFRTKSPSCGFVGTQLCRPELKWIQFHNPLSILFNDLLLSPVIYVEEKILGKTTKGNW